MGLKMAFLPSPLQLLDLWIRIGDRRSFRKGMEYEQFRNELSTILIAQRISGTKTIPEERAAKLCAQANSDEVFFRGSTVMSRRELIILKRNLFASIPYR